jgi:hypothetical protein
LLRRLGECECSEFRRDDSAYAVHRRWDSGKCFSRPFSNIPAISWHTTAQTQGPWPNPTPDNQYVYALTDYGRKAAALLVILSNCIPRPIAASIFERPPKLSLKTNSKHQAQYRRTTKSVNDLIAIIKAA